MSIQRTDINGNIQALKAALETLVPDFFATIEYDDAESPTKIICKDADGHTLMTASRTNTNWKWEVYKNESTAVVYGSLSSAPFALPAYFYSVGSNGAVIVCGTQSQVILIAKTNTGATGIALPTGSTTNSSKFEVYPTCWGDDPALTDPLYAFMTTTHSGIGNHTMFVQIPLHGTYDQIMYLPKAFFMPMVQTGMRGVIQQITTESGVYLTNGYIALQDS